VTKFCFGDIDIGNGYLMMVYYLMMVWFCTRAENLKFSYFSCLNSEPLLPVTHDVTLFGEVLTGGVLILSSLFRGD
jgi:hypothetical protein